MFWVKDRWVVGWADSFSCVIGKWCHLPEWDSGPLQLCPEVRLLPSPLMMMMVGSFYSPLHLRGNDMESDYQMWQTKRGHILLLLLCSPWPVDEEDGGRATTLAAPPPPPPPPPLVWEQTLAWRAAAFCL